MTEKQILLEFENLRIRKFDKSNVFVEVKETYFSPKENKCVTDYQFKGYYSTVLRALEAISIKEWLIDKNDVTDAETLLKEIKKSNSIVIKLLEAIRDEK